VKYCPFYQLVNSSSTEIDLAACEPCFISQISNSPLASSFKRVQAKSSSEADQDTFLTTRCACDFALPRVARLWHLQCIPQGSVQPLVEYALEALAWQPCSGSNARTAGVMYEATNNAIPNFGMCPACFEKHFKGSPYEKHFRVYPDMPPQTQWVCDVGSMPYLREIIDRSLPAHENDFGFFAHWANYRMKLPPCPGESKPIQFSDSTPQHERVAFITSLGIGGSACPACFSDKLYASPLEQYFLSKPCPPNETCDFALPASGPPLIVARRSGNLRVWQDAVKGYLQDTPPCSGAAGLTDEDLETLRQKATQQAGAMVEWYSLSEYPGLEICPRCFVSLVVPFEAAHLFTRVDRPLREGGVRACNFSNVPSSENYIARCTALREAVFHGWDTGCRDFTILSNFAKVLATCGEPCAGDARKFSQSSGRQWFAHIAPNKDDPNDCTLVVCQECYKEYVDGKSLAHLFRDVTADVYAARKNAVSCDPYSPRAKGYLKEAFEKDDWSHFARYWRKREEVQSRTVPQIAYCTQMYHMQNQNKLSMYMNASVVRGGASVLAAVTSDQGQRYGNSTVSEVPSPELETDTAILAQIGYNNITRAGAEADMMFNNAQNASWGNTDLLVRARMLEQEWKAIE
jgi:hypothetical protein